MSANPLMTLIRGRAAAQRRNLSPSPPRLPTRTCWPGSSPLAVPWSSCARFISGPATSAARASCPRGKRAPATGFTWRCHGCGVKGSADTIFTEPYLGRRREAGPGRRQRPRRPVPLYAPRGSAMTRAEAAVVLAAYGYGPDEAAELLTLAEADPYGAASPSVGLHVGRRPAPRSPTGRCRARCRRTNGCGRRATWTGRAATRRKCERPAPRVQHGRQREPRRADRLGDRSEDSSSGSNPDADSHTGQDR